MNGNETLRLNGFHSSSGTPTIDFGQTELMIFGTRTIPLAHSGLVEILVWNINDKSQNGVSFVCSHENIKFRLDKMCSFRINGTNAFYIWVQNNVEIVKTNILNHNRRSGHFNFYMFLPAKQCDSSHYHSKSKQNIITIYSLIISLDFFQTWYEVAWTLPLWFMTKMTVTDKTKSWKGFLPVFFELRLFQNWYKTFKESQLLLDNAQDIILRVLCPSWYNHIVILQTTSHQYLFFSFLIKT